MIALALLLAQVAVPAPAPIAPGAGAAAPVTEADPSGSAEDVYARRCVICHAADGKGQTKKGIQLRVPDFTSAKWQKHTRDDEITGIIENGNKKRKMPAYKDKLTADQIKALVPYLRAFARK